MASIELLATVERLVGASNFEPWKMAISAILQVESLWGHVEGEENLLNPTHYLAIQHKPPAVTPISTAAEIETYNSWALADSKAILVITIRIAPALVSLLPQGTDRTARVIWRTVHDFFGRRGMTSGIYPQNRPTNRKMKAHQNTFSGPDIISAIELRNTLLSLRMKDHHDYANYLSKFRKARVRFAAMQFPYSELEMVHTIINGLPKHGVWPHFAMMMFHMMQAHINEQAVAARPAPPDTLLKRIIDAITVESLRLQSTNASSKKKVPKAG